MGRVEIVTVRTLHVAAAAVTHLGVLEVLTVLYVDDSVAYDKCERWFHADYTNINPSFDNLEGVCDDCV